MSLDSLVDDSVHFQRRVNFGRGAEERGRVNFGQSADECVTVIGWPRRMVQAAAAMLTMLATMGTVGEAQLFVRCGVGVW